MQKPRRRISSEQERNSEHHCAVHKQQQRARLVRRHKEQHEREQWRKQYHKIVRPPSDIVPLGKGLRIRSEVGASQYEVKPLGVLASKLLLGELSLVLGNPEGSELSLVLGNPEGDV